MVVTIGGLFWALLLSSTCLRCVLLDVYSKESETLFVNEEHLRLAHPNPGLPNFASCTSQSCTA